MGIVKVERVHVSAVTAARLYKASVLDAINIFPKALPNFVRSAELVEGDGGPGSIKKLNLVVGTVKHRVDLVDAENYVYHYTVVEGTVTSEPLEKVSYEYTFVGSPDGGCTVKSTAIYHTKGDAQLSEEFLKVNLERAFTFTKAVEDYLWANPDYN